MTQHSSIVTPQTTLNAAERAQRRRNRWSMLGLMAPGVFWLVVFFAIPLLVIVAYSLLTPNRSGIGALPLTLGNYQELFTRSIYLNAYWRSLWVGIITTGACLVLGYPLALYIIRRTPRWRSILLFLVLIPFWTNFLIRTYAWMLILGNIGVLNTLFQAIGLPRQPMINTMGAVLVGLIYGELPFMVLPIYASLDRFDFTLMEAASDLGATRARAFWRIMLPMTLPGVTAGSVLVFIPTVGQFVVSDLLGGAKVDLLGNLLQRLFTRSNPPNWPLGSAMALVFLVIMTVAILLYFRMTTEDER